MISPPTPLSISRLSHVATGTGFDLGHGLDQGWVYFKSSKCPLQVWLASFGEDAFIAAMSMENVLRALDDYGVAMASPLPEGARGARMVPSIEELYPLLRRAFQLSRSLPNEPLEAFRARTATMPVRTEVERLARQRIGQDIFRESLLDYWQGRCAITGLALPRLLRASHIKPWAACERDEERLDVYNGLLLAPHFDALFDLGLMTVDEDGALIFSAELVEEARAALGVEASHRVIGLREGHLHYLNWHRENLFGRGADEPSVLSV